MKLIDLINWNAYICKPSLRNMFVIDQQSGKHEEVLFQEATNQDLIRLSKSTRFGFDWRNEANYEIIALILREKEEILGVASFRDFPSELRIHMNLLELARENQGKKKKYGRVAGCLIAKGCRNSFLKGYAGFLSLIPKTVLIQHYQKVYGFQPFGNHLAVFGNHSMALIEKYLKND